MLGYFVSPDFMRPLRNFCYFKTSPRTIRRPVMIDIRYPISLWTNEDLLHERGIDVAHEAVRFWLNRFG